MVVWPKIEYFSESVCSQKSSENIIKIRNEIRPQRTEKLFELLPLQNSAHPRGATKVTYMQPAFSPLFFAVLCVLFFGGSMLHSSPQALNSIAFESDFLAIRKT